MKTQEKSKKENKSEETVVEEPRRGRQTPTVSFVLPYTVTDGAKAVDLYNRTGRKAQEWQELLLYDMLAKNNDGLWTHSKYGYAIPRRNGKNEVVVMREMYGLVNLGEHILHTAHRTTTTHSAWERLLDMLALAGAEILTSYKAFGKECIEVEGGGKIEFRTRTSKGGLGEGFDLLIIDEAQEYQDDQESALKYVVSDSRNPQTIFTGTPPTAVSSGTVFPKFRADVLSGKKENSAWAEWSVQKKTDVYDREAWYETNPSLGTVLTERKILDEIGSDADDFNIQRLGLWSQQNLKSAISKNEWEYMTAPKLPDLRGKMFIGIKYAHDGQTVSLSIAIKTADKKIFVEAVDCQTVRNGNAWILTFLQSVKASTGQVVVDGASGQGTLSAEMKDARLKPPTLPTVKEIIVANSAFEQAVFCQSICHMNQPSLTQSVTNCEHRAIGSGGGFGYQSIKDGVDITLLDSVVLAYWAAVTEKPKSSKPQVRY